MHDDRKSAEAAGRLVRLGLICGSDVAPMSSGMRMPSESSA